MQKLKSDFVVEYIHSFNTHVREIHLRYSNPMVTNFKHCLVTCLSFNWPTKTHQCAFEGAQSDVAHHHGVL